MTEAEALSLAVHKIWEGAPNPKPTEAALAVCAAYEKALLEFGPRRVVLPSYLMAALEMLCTECGR